MAKAGRTQALDDLNQREVYALVSAGCSLVGAARYVGCNAKTNSAVSRELASNFQSG